MNKPDIELFELCKEVVEKTSWGGTKEFYCSGNIIPHMMMDDDDFMGEVVPLYTSDYLLEKLPKTIWSTYGLGIFPGEHVSVAGYYDPDGLVGVEVDALQKANTPQKALLKLTLALHKAGELNV